MTLSLGYAPESGIGNPTTAASITQPTAGINAPRDLICMWSKLTTILILAALSHDARYQVTIHGMV